MTDPLPPNWKEHAEHFPPAWQLALIVLAAVATLALAAYGAYAIIAGL